jgi:hypothetical protein
LIQDIAEVPLAATWSASHSELADLIDASRDLHRLLWTTEVLSEPANFKAVS